MSVNGQSDSYPRFRGHSPRGSRCHGAGQMLEVSLRCCLSVDRHRVQSFRGPPGGTCSEALFRGLAGPRRSLDREGLSPTEWRDHVAEHPHVRGGGGAPRGQGEGKLSRPRWHRDLPSSCLLKTHGMVDGTFGLQECGRASAGGWLGTP